jgi:ankyrin repeat protein
MSDAHAFFDACAAGDVDLLRRLLASDPVLVRATNPKGQYPGWTGLHTASLAGHLDAVRLLLEHGADPNARERGDNTYPLHWAAASRHLEIVRALIEAGGDVHGTGDVHGLDLIGWATFYHPDAGAPGDRLEVASLLVERGARHHIFSAISVGDPDLIRALVAENPAALDRRMSCFEHGLTPLHLAIQLKRYDILDLLIDLGADLEAEDGSGNSPLMSATLQGDQRAAGRLEAAGAKRPAFVDPATLKAGMASLAGSVSKGVPMINVPDVAATLEWYTSIGFTELARYGGDGVVSFGMLSFGNAELMLNAYGKPGQSVGLWFYTDKVDELYRLLKSRQGTAFQEALYDPFYGGRQFSITDLNGFTLVFYSI